MQSSYELDSVVSVLLREPLATARQSLRQNKSHCSALERRRNRFLSASMLKRHLSKFLFPQQNDVEELFIRDTRSRIIAAYHFGDYVYGMHHFATRFNHKNDFSYLSFERGSVAYFTNLNTAFGKQALGVKEQLLRSQTPPTELSAVLRRQSHNLILFCDLPGGSQESVEVELLFRTANFPSGPATLALANRVPILPVVTFCQGKRHIIEVNSQIEPVVNSEESFSGAVKRITQSLAYILEKYLNKYPQQWRYLNLLPQYFEPAGTQ